MDANVSAPRRKIYRGMPFRILVLLGAVALGVFIYCNFVDDGIRTIVQNPGLQAVHAIGLAMFSYAQDHDGAYPTGKSSIEVFQKLVDGGYVIDPTIFYLDVLKIPGKSKATSKTLKPENVCLDVTVPVVASSPDSVPLIFATGYRVNYTSRGEAVPIPSNNRPVGMMVYYHNNASCWFKDDGLPDGKVENFVPADFDPKGKTYTQLTPDGPLSP